MTGKSQPATWAQLDSSTQLSKTIPAMFCTQPEDTSSASTGLPQGMGAGYPLSPLCMSDLQQVALAIENAMYAAIADLKGEIRAVAAQMDRMESAAMTHGAAIQQVQRAPTSHAQHLIDMHRHMEDLGNRGRRHNLHIRGIPELVEKV